MIIQYLHTESIGHQRYTIELGEALMEQGRAVALLTSAEAPRLASPLRTLREFPSIDLASRGLARISNRLQTYAQYPKVLRDVLMREHQDSGDNVLHLQELPGWRVSRFVSVTRDCGFASILTVHNARPHRRSFASPILERFRHRHWRQMDAIIVHSNALVEPLIRAGVRPDRVFVTPHPIWPVRRQQTSPTRDFLMFGVLRENKGVFRFLRALRELGDPPAGIYGHGETSIVQRIQATVNQLGLTNCEFHPGHVDDAALPALFARHRVVVAPYDGFDAQSGVTHLALAYGRPIVVTDTGALGDLVRQFSVGELVIKGDSLVEKMRQCLENGERGLYDSGIEQALATLSVDRFAQETIKAYASVGATLTPSKPE